MGVLAGICEADARRRQEQAGLYPGIPVFATPHEMVDRLGSLPTVVATPPFTHYAVTKALLEAGCDVLVEKPMTVVGDEARDLVELAEARDRILMVGHLLLYHPAVEALQTRLDSLGRIHYLHVQRLNLGRVRREENVLWSFAPHDIAVMLHVLGESPEAVSCLGGGFVQPTVEDVAFMHLRFPSGRLASIQVGWLEPQRVRVLKIVGEQGCAVLDELGEKPLTILRQRIDPASLEARKSDVEVVPVATEEPLMNECAHFLECTRTRSRPRSPGEQGLAVVRILECASNSLRRGGDWVTVKHDELHSRVGTAG